MGRLATYMAGQIFVPMHSDPHQLRRATYRRRGALTQHSVLSVGITCINQLIDYLHFCAELQAKHSNEALCCRITPNQLQWTVLKMQVLPPSPPTVHDTQPSCTGAQLTPRGRRNKAVCLQRCGRHTWRGTSVGRLHSMPWQPMSKPKPHCRGPVPQSQGWISATGAELVWTAAAAILRLSTSRPAVISLTESAGECGTRASDTTGMMPRRGRTLGDPPTLPGACEAGSFCWLLATDVPPPLEPVELRSFASCSRLASCAVHGQPRYAFVGTIDSSLLGSTQYWLQP